MSSKLTADYVRQRISYDAETGVLKWKERPVLSRIEKMWNKRFADTEITHRNSSGHIQFGLDGKNYLGHRIAWLITYGEWPGMGLDHINRIRDDNRLSNLRLATRSQNGANSVRGKQSKSGFRGVFFQFGTWKARIGKNNEKIYLGGYRSSEDAALAYNFAALNMHGDFAVLNVAA